jgi:dihydroxyacetone kinase DhaKLM complex PTS-EIIA-like component DhaM
MAPSSELKIRVAAGLGDEQDEIGTNAVEIMEV